MWSVNSLSCYVVMLGLLSRVYLYIYIYMCVCIYKSHGYSQRCSVQTRQPMQYMHKLESNEPRWGFFSCSFLSLSLSLSLCFFLIVCPSRDLLALGISSKFLCSPVGGITTTASVMCTMIRIWAHREVWKSKLCKNTWGM